MEPPKNLRIELKPYAHLRDDDGCVLARDYIHAGKLEFILTAVSDKLKTAAASPLTTIECRIRELLSPCIDTRAPYAKVLIVELAKLVYDEGEACAKLAEDMSRFRDSEIANAIRARHAADTPPSEG
jgi:hypothetical protein